VDQGHLLDRNRSSEDSELLAGTPWSRLAIRNHGVGTCLPSWSGHGKSAVARQRHSAGWRNRPIASAAMTCIDSTTWL
jgi:hypothetical protein